MDRKELFEIYNGFRGGTTEEQFYRILNYTPTEVDRGEARKVLGRTDRDNCQTSENGIETVARIIGALGTEVPKDRLGRPDPYWLKIEGILYSGVLVFSGKIR